MKTKPITFILCLFLLASYTFAQPTLIGQKAVGGHGSDDLEAMVKTADGGLLAAGTSYSDSSGNKTEDSRGQGDYWLVKFDAKGRLEWDRTIGGSNSDVLITMRNTPDGGYILGGWSRSDASGEKTNDRINTVDFWVVKLDASFNIVWDKDYGVMDNNYSYSSLLRSVESTSDGGFIISGVTNYNTLPPPPIYGLYKSLVIKIDAGGNIQWNKIIDHYGLSWSVYAQETTGGYMLGVGARQTDFSELWFTAIKLDYDGNTIWEKNYRMPEGGDSRLTCMIPMNSGRFLLGGYASGLNANPDISRDIRLLLINSQGDVLSDKIVGSNGEDLLNNMIKTADGGVMLASSSDGGISRDKTEQSRGGSDYWVVKLDNDLNIQWDKTIGSSSGDGASSILAVSGQRYLIGGSSSGMISGDKTAPRRGQSDYWGIVLQALPAPPTVEKTGFTVYPNPAKNTVYIELKGTALFTLTDKTGNTLFSKSIFNKGSFDVSRLKPGIYFISTPGGTMKQVLVGR